MSYPPPTYHIAIQDKFRMKDLINIIIWKATKRETFYNIKLNLKLNIHSIIRNYFFHGSPDMPYFMNRIIICILDAKK